MPDGKIEFHDRELQKLLNLTTADLRFADILVKAVVGDEEESPFETTGTHIYVWIENLEKSGQNYYWY